MAINTSNELRKELQEDLPNFIGFLGILRDNFGDNITVGDIIEMLESAQQNSIVLTMLLSITTPTPTPTPKKTPTSGK